MSKTSERSSANLLRNLPILHEDESLLVVSKPPGMSVHGGAGDEGVNAIDLLRQARPRSDALHLVHRLDKGTSGVLLLAKSARVARALSNAWESCRKEYLALVLGAVGATGRIRSIRTPLTSSDGRRQSAQTDVEPLARLEGLGLVTSFVRVIISTGRMHQIRRHLAEEGHPVLMDRQYGDFAANRRWAEAIRQVTGMRPKHTMLHAAELVLGEQPFRAGGAISFRANCPTRWEEILRASGAKVDLLGQLT